MIHDHALVILCEKQDQQCIFRYLSLLYYKQRILLHVSATCCSCLQWAFLCRMCCAER